MLVRRPSSDALQTVEPSDRLDPRQVLALLRRQFWVILVCVGISLSFAGLWLLQVVPIYSASAQLLLVPRKERALATDAVIADLSSDANSIATELTLVRSFSVAARVVERLKLDEEPAFMGRSGPGLLGWIRSLVTGRDKASANEAGRSDASESRETDSDADKDPAALRGGVGVPGAGRKPEAEVARAAVASIQSPSDSLNNNSERGLGFSTLGISGGSNGSTPADAVVSPAVLSAAARVQAATSVARFGATYFITISYNHPDPKRAAMLANAVAESYLMEQLEARYQAARRAAGWLSERLSALRIKLDKSEQELADFRAANNVLSAKSGSIADQQAAEINQQLVTARTQTIEKQTKYEQTQRIAESGVGIETVASIIDSPIIATLRQTELSLARAESEQLTKYGPEHPAIVKARAERADIKRQIRMEIARVVQQFKTDFDLAQKKEKSLEQSLEQLMKNARSNPVAIKLRELETETNANRALYESLLGRFKEAEQQTNYQTAESRVVAPATMPGSPAFPNPGRTLMLALFGGLMLGVGAALFREYVESGFTTFEQIETLLKLPVLSAIPDFTDVERTVDKRVLELPEFVAAKPLSRVGECVRTVRVATRMSNIDDPPKLVLVTSSVPSEGKSTLALSLAYSAAAGGLRTLIIDCDLRHPSASHFFGLDQRKAGLTDLLLGSVSPEQAFVRGPISTLVVLPAGAVTHHPPDVLGSEKMKQLLAGLRETYDVVYIDAPPLLPVIDASLLVPLVDKIVYVVHWRATAREVVQRSLQQIEGSRKKIAGVVLNKVHLDTLSTYSSYYGDYAKKYRNYYTQ